MSEQQVLVTRRMPPPAERLLRGAGFAVEVIDSEEPPSRAQFLSRLRGKAGLLAMLSDCVDAEALEAAGPGLRVVADYAVGFDNIDLAECTRRGVRVTNTPGVLTDATADLAWALILATTRRVCEGDQLVRAGGWRGWSGTQLLGLQLSGATLGLLGVGRIGTAVGLRSLGFGMRVLYTDARVNDELEQQVAARRVGLEELVTQSDVLSLHIPFAPESRHLIGAREFDLMKRSAVLINTARGPLVDEPALVAALRAGNIAGAGLDVYEDEPRLAVGLAELPNVVLLPHLGSATTATRERMSAMAAENVIAVLRGSDPPNPVN
ncbi:MAG: D-glycerate dehydrogenase [Planctomycetes bacterium]|nr:D-glycerate dehydrogenase [Planctomycetota bacterium]